MDSVIITPKSKTELEFLNSFFKRTNIKARTLSEPEKFDIATLLAMEEAANEKGFAKRSDVMKALETKTKVQPKRSNGK